MMAAPRRLREEEDWRIELQVSLGYTARLHFSKKRKTNNHCIKVHEVIWIIAKRENQSSKLGERPAPRLDAHTRTPLDANPVHTRTPCQTPSPVSLEARGPPLSLLSLEQVLSRPRLHNLGFHTEIKPGAQFGGVKGSWEKGRLTGWASPSYREISRHTAQSTWSMVLNMDFFNSTHDKKIILKS